MVYIGSSCSLLVIDRGNRAIREIQLHFDDCAYQYGTGFPLGILIYSQIYTFVICLHNLVLIFVVAGIAMLIGAGFFGYMLALLQRRVGTIVSSQNVSILFKLIFTHPLLELGKVGYGKGFIILPLTLCF